MEFWKTMSKLIPLFLIMLFVSIVFLFIYISWATLLRRNELWSNSGVIGSQNTGGGEFQINDHETSQNSEKIEDKELIGLSNVDETLLYGEELYRAVERRKMKVISTLRRYVIDGAKVVSHINEYGVNFTKLRAKFRLNSKLKPDKILCLIKKLNFEVLSSSSSSVFRAKKFPNANLFESSNEEPPYRSCAVVPSSGALDGAQHGIDIDSHDFVIRFNNAPTKGWEEDVGTLTSLRVINSQVFTKEQFKFPSSEYFNTNKSEVILEDEKRSDELWSSTQKYLIWDPCNYTSTIEDWYKKPDHPLFDKYFELQRDASKYGKNRFYILSCRVLWSLWEILYQNTFAKIYGNPPTSGFLGIILAMQKCEKVNVYEYIPSVRESQRCHYYSPKNDSNPSCTYGSWHPVSAEKLFFLQLSNSADKEIYMDGVLSLPGTSTVNC